MTPRGESPGRVTPAGTSANSDGKNHVNPLVNGTPEAAAPIQSGRPPAALLPRKPSAAGSTPLEVTVRGEPLATLVMPESCQPPSALPAKPFSSRKNGSS